MTDGERGVGALGEEMIGETEEMVIPSSWLQRLSKRQVYLIIVGCTTLGSAVSLQVYSNADMQRRLSVLELEMRHQAKEQGDRSIDQLVVITKLTERLEAMTKRFDAFDARLSEIDRNVRRMAQ
jgi:hypothetical protein